MPPTLGDTRLLTTGLTASRPSRQTRMARGSDTEPDERCDLAVVQANPSFRAILRAMEMECPYARWPQRPGRAPASQGSTSPPRLNPNVRVRHGRLPLRVTASSCRTAVDSCEDPIAPPSSSSALPKRFHSTISDLLVRRCDGRRSASEADSRGWAVPGSNGRPPACKAGALPTELTAQARESSIRLRERPALLEGARRAGGSGGDPVRHPRPGTV
jgi:hypothetical protein